MVLYFFTALLTLPFDFCFVKRGNENWELCVYCLSVHANQIKIPSADAEKTGTKVTDLTLLSVCVSDRVKCFAEFLKWFGSVVSSIINTENWSPISSWEKSMCTWGSVKVAIESGMLKNGFD